MSIKALISILLLIAFGAAAAFAGKAVGEISYFSGDVSIARNGEILSGAKLLIGDVIEDFDLIRTGPSGAMDLILRTPQKQQIRLKVRANTSFSIETAKLEAGKERTSLQMMSGTLACKVDQLTGNQLQVKTKSAAMGVKGTNFEVTTSPTNDILVTCDEGAVACTDEESGAQAVAQPGEVVERPADAELVSSRVDPADLDGFRRKWLDLRIEKFKAVAARHILGLVRLFNPAYNRLQGDFTALEKKSALLRKWIDEDKRGITPSPAEVRKDNLDIFASLVKVKAYLLVFEPLFYRLVDLEYYYGLGYGGDDPAVKTFFASFGEKQRHIEVMLSTTRHYIKLYAARNGGFFPVDIGAGFERGVDGAKSAIDKAFR